MPRTHMLTKIKWLGGGLLLAVASCVGPGDMSAPLSDQDLVGAWVGISEDQAHYVRLELDPGGQGRIAVVFLTQTTSVFSIDRWECRDGHVTLATSPLNPNPSQIRFAGKASNGQKISLTMAGPDWQRTCLLRKEAELLSRDRMARETLNSASSNNPR